MDFDYNIITDQQFDKALTAIVNNMNAEQILAIPEVNTVLREHFNNEVLSDCEEEALNDYMNNLKFLIQKKHLEKELLKGYVCEHCVDAGTLGWSNKDITIWSTPNWEDDIKNDVLTIEVTDRDGNNEYFEYEWKLTFNESDDVNNYFSILTENLEEFESAELS